ncbi:MAG: hypothetical protein D4R67_07890 [Bacteroidetes bacterium]|nr:MAG: hypothetical protein D4R67_07890 [Bacteroidota bacterium]
MKIFFLLPLIISFLISTSVFSQVQPLTGNELPGAILSGTSTYDPQSIWNYSGDAAPVLSEYGFNSLLVQNFTVGQENFMLQAYLMNTPEAAYGMYSTSILKCSVQDSITSWDCLAQSQYQAAYGPFYIVITNESGPASLPYSYTIMQKFMLLNPQTPLKLPDVFDAPAFEGNRNQVDFVSGMLGMQNSLLGWENLIVGVRFAMFAVILPDPRGEIYFAQISFPTQADLYNFLTRAKLMQNGVPVQAYNNYGFLFREFTPVDPSNPLTIYFLQCTQPVSIAEVTEE